MASISIVIPSFQHAQFIEETLRSVLDQQVNSIEVLVQDGGSTDGTVEILQRYCDRVRWVSAKDGGQSAAINEGLRKTSGEVVCYLNSDDLLSPGSLEKVSAFFEANPEVDMIYGNADFIDQDGQPMGSYPTEPWDYSRLLSNCFISQPACFWRRRVHDRCGYFNEALHFSMDYDFWLRVGKESKVAYLPETLAIARRHTDAKTVKLRADSFEEAFQTMLAHHGKPVPRRWILALAQARAEKHLSGKTRTPGAWSRFVREYCQQATQLKADFGCGEPFKLASSILPHCISAWKKTGKVC